MIVLGIDPGVVTGLALLSIDEFQSKLIWLDSKTFSESCFLLTTIQPNLVVFETAPFAGNPDQYSRVEVLRDIVNSYGFRSIEVNPGNWKPFIKASKWTHPSAKTQHEKDAYNFTRWAILNHYQKDIGIL